MLYTSKLIYMTNTKSPRNERENCILLYHLIGTMQKAWSNYQFQYMYVNHSIHSIKINQNKHKIKHTPGPSQFLEIISDDEREKPAKELDVSNKKLPQKTVGIFLYYV